MICFGGAISLQALGYNLHKSINLVRVGKNLVDCLNFDRWNLDEIDKEVLFH